MQRWNGWGDPHHRHPMPAGAEDYLQARLGPPLAAPEARKDAVLALVPESRLPGHTLIKTDADVRLRHARGQSFPDWLALRTGQVGVFPDGVAFPETDDDVAALLIYAREVDARVIPYGGGTSVAGHINPTPGDRPVLTLSLARINKLESLLPESRLATFGAGVRGPDLEAALRAQGFTLGHYPQSFEYSTLGGWVATRSSGQQSLYYGRVEALFAGGTLIGPTARLEMPPLPASAAGPDLRQMVLGSEGRLGVLTRATVRISPTPRYEQFTGIFFPDFAAGLAAVQAIVQARIPVSMLRLSTAVETETNLRLAGKPGLIRRLEDLLSARGLKDEKVMLLLGVTGSSRVTAAVGRAALALAHAHGGVSRGFGTVFGRTWAKSRFSTPYLRNTLWEAGYGIDTFETATTWDQAPALLDAMERSLHQVMASDEATHHTFTHLSHTYPTGTSIYTTMVFRLLPDADAMLDQWRRFKHAISQAIVAHGGTISHQHGVGADHAPYLATEKGDAGIEMLAALISHADPDGMMNPGKLIV